MLVPWGARDVSPMSHTSFFVAIADMLEPDLDHSQPGKRRSILLLLFFPLVKFQYNCDIVESNTILCVAHTPHTRTPSPDDVN